MTQRALIVGSGGLKGAYDAGVVATLGRELGPDYFSHIYGTSVGVFAATFYEQPDVIENTWRKYVSEAQLVNYSNLVKPNKNILDLEYLIETFKDDRSKLDVDAVMESDTVLTYVLTKHPSGETVYHTPTQEDLFDAMMASAAVPFLHPPVRVNGGVYCDGALSDKMPIKKAIDDGNEEIIVVTNKVRHVSDKFKINMLVNPISYVLPKKIARLVRKRDDNDRQLERTIDDSRVILIRPEEKLPLSLLTRNKTKINYGIDKGIEDATKFLETYKP
ncbi:hypothetical protein CL622_03295 [archaeon]|nr:hypothetical protein [archaeon]